MKTFFVLLSFFTLSIFISSCAKNNDCNCTVNTNKKASIEKIPVYDWGGSCSTITADKIPNTDPNADVVCSEM